MSLLHMETIFNRKFIDKSFNNYRLIYMKRKIVFKSTSNKPGSI